ncbi:hypothetical protein nbrc107697_00690 [Gordonia crocea]|uniref:Uncharacterized protein n=1 Tax=Gordonia crocea TaxID=589162 RepID=A0A7M4BQ69_9ACTN|nr:hypothetical protein nbrc107697_00690 [Gordonia crocea]
MGGERGGPRSRRRFADSLTVRELTEEHLATWLAKRSENRHASGVDESSEAVQTLMGQCGLGSVRCEMSTAPGLRAER